MRVLDSGGSGRQRCHWHMPMCRCDPNNMPRRRDDDKQPPSEFDAPVDLGTDQCDPPPALLPLLLVLLLLLLCRTQKAR